MTEGTDWVVFEQPLNERVRSFLRLEFLFDQYRHHRARTSLWNNRAALHTLLDVMSVIGRSDLKTDLLKDLSGQHTALSRLAEREEIDQSRLQEVLVDLHKVCVDLQATGTSYPATMLRGSDLLSAVLNRFAIPGGTCAFDLPAYHRWLSLPHERILADLDHWFGQLDALEAAVRIYLRLLRDSTESSEQTTENGVFLYTPRAHYHMIRVLTSSALDIYPEISATRHRFSIRFMRLGDVNTRNVQEPSPVPFLMQCCALTSTA